MFRLTATAQQSIPLSAAIEVVSSDLSSIARRTAEDAPSDLVLERVRALEARIDREVSGAGQAFASVLELQHRTRAEQEAWGEEILGTIHGYALNARAEADATATALAKAITFGLTQLVTTRAEQEAWFDNTLAAVSCVEGQLRVQGPTPTR